MKHEAKPLWREYPTSPANRRLTDEPLSAEDWYAVWLAYRAFISQIRIIVQLARDRKARP